MSSPFSGLIVAPIDTLLFLNRLKNAESMSMEKAAADMPGRILGVVCQ